MKKFNANILILGIACLLTGCETLYYNSMEKFGIEKREILVDRVADARDAQNETKETFDNALDAFMAMTDYEGGELETMYNRMNERYKESVDAAESVSEEIKSVKKVAQALFEEWEKELAQYSNQKLQNKSSQALEETRQQYYKLISKMETAEQSMQPVLSLFKDHVLYLKHNLNAQAVSALDGEVSNIRQEVQKLIESMEAAITETNAFINSMQAS